MNIRWIPGAVCDVDGEECGGNKTRWSISNPGGLDFEQNNPISDETIILHVVSTRIRSHHMWQDTQTGSGLHKIEMLLVSPIKESRDGQ